MYCQGVVSTISCSDTCFLSFEMDFNSTFAVGSSHRLPCIYIYNLHFFIVSARCIVMHQPCRLDPFRPEGRHVGCAVTIERPGPKTHNTSKISTPTLASEEHLFFFFFFSGMAHSLHFYFLHYIKSSRMQPLK